MQCAALHADMLLIPEPLEVAAAAAAAAAAASDVDFSCLPTSQLLSLPAERRTQSLYPEAGQCSRGAKGNMVKLMWHVTCRRHTPRVTLCQVHSATAKLTIAMRLAGWMMPC
jgi:hypothetical protein